MEKEFIPYEQALALKELGFDEPCICCYDSKKLVHLLVNCTENNELIDCKISTYFDKDLIKSPLYQQAFRWFREKYNLHHSISILQRSCRYHFKIRTIECESDLKPFGDNKIIFEDGPRKKYEDIELDCLKKLIEIVKDGKK